MGHVRAKIDLVAVEGTTFEKHFVWKTGDPASAVDMTGYTGTCHIRDRIDDEEPVFILEDDTGVVIKDQTDDPGGYKMYLPYDESSGMCEAHRERRMVYDLRLIAPDGEVRLQQYGEFKLLPAVTRPWETQ